MRLWLITPTIVPPMETMSASMAITSVLSILLCIPIIAWCTDPIFVETLELVTDSARCLGWSPLGARQITRTTCLAED